MSIPTRWITRAGVAFVAAAATLFGANGCLVSFPEYQVGELNAAGGKGGQGANVGTSGTDASTTGGASGAGGAGGGSGDGGLDAAPHEGGDGGPSCTNGIVDGDETDMDC